MLLMLSQVMALGPSGESVQKSLMSQATVHQLVVVGMGEEISRQLQQA